MTPELKKGAKLKTNDGGTIRVRALLPLTLSDGLRDLRVYDCTVDYPNTTIYVRYLENGAPMIGEEFHAMSAVGCPMTELPFLTLEPGSPGKLAFKDLKDGDYFFFKGHASEARVLYKEGQWAGTQTLPPCSFKVAPDAEVVRVLVDRGDHVP